ncbi:ATP-binding protein [Paenibacillaceae bacterium WGS1546]|uniref:ATP-binding protein n=1 Tax=Cohnella sp. WGS1546 TaxID=3366810 RepID=UPI00372D06B3
MPDKQPVPLLLVDDHDENLLALEAMLDGEGYRLVRASSGEEALRLLLREPFAAIVLDVQMPGMDGFETARLIKERERTKDIPILFISATSKETVHQFEGYSAGAIDYLVKPVTPSIVRAKLAAFARLYLNNRELELKRNELSQQKAELEAVNLKLLEATYELSTAEAKSRMIFDTSIDGIFTFDARGSILSANPAMERLFGYSVAEMIGMPGETLLPNLRTMSRPVPKRLAAGEGESRYLTGLVSEMRALRRRGDSFEAEIQLGEAVINEQRLYACTVRDITERKGTLRQLTEAKNAAERASRAKSDFLAMMSHEIRTPLNGLIGMSELLMESAESEDRKVFPRAILDNANRLLEIMNDILEFTRTESGGAEVEWRPFSVSETIAEVMDGFKAEAVKKRLACAVAIDPGVPEIVMGDPAKYRQILRRLVDNAIKFTDRGRVDVRAKLGTPEREGRAPTILETAVQDTGIGIPSEKREMLFLPFTQLDSSLTRSFGGMGMGLAVSQALAKAVGGEIRLASREGPGAEFTFSFPVEPFAGGDAPAE